jgi:hypothetical protein
MLSFFFSKSKNTLKERIFLQILQFRCNYSDTVHIQIQSLYIIYSNLSISSLFKTLLENNLIQCTNISQIA